MKKETKKYLISVIKELTPEDFRATLFHYGISVRSRDGMLPCPNSNYDEQHYGSCYLTSDEKACHCDVCWKTMNSVDVVMLQERLGFLDAAEKLWTDVLGNSIPDDGEAG